MSRAAVIVAKSTRGTGRKPYLRCLAPRWNNRSGLSRSWLLDDWPSPMKSAS